VLLRSNSITSKVIGKIFYDYGMKKTEQVEHDNRPCQPGDSYLTNM
jgi:hypothetical protein